jgi:hypothetical protein
MKRNTLFNLLLALGLVLALGSGTMMAHQILAQGPGPQGPLDVTHDLGTAFTYQGQLKKGDSPVDGACEMAFRLYDAAAGGGQAGSAISTTVPITGGLFTVNLDFGGGVFTGDGRWLGIRVKCAGDSAYADLGRQALTAAPYALYAASAPWSGLSGVPADFADGVDDDTLAALPCADGQIAEWNDAAGQWECGDDDTGTAGDFWSLTGNGGTTPGTHFLGTTDEVSLTLVVSGTAALRLEPNATSPNLIGGHASNTVNAGLYGATVGGGGSSTSPNCVTSYFGTIGGGLGNEAGGYASVVGGGWGNEAGGFGAVIGGGRENATTRSGLPFNGPTIGGGQGNTVSASYGTIGGGLGNTASTAGATVGGGYYNVVTATGASATIAGGHSNIASGLFSTIGGGSANTTSGYHAMVPGGYNNTAQGNFSFAAGRRAQANHDGAFVWGDDHPADIYSPADNTFIVRASGGIWFGDVTTNPYTPTIGSGVFISTSTGAYLSTGGTWTNVSDRDQKENLAPVEGREVLARLAEIPITTWNYKAQDPTIRHIGPMAQDFYAAFGLGKDERHISTIDADGVALAAIQELYAQNQALEAENVALRQRMDDLEGRVAALEAAPGRPLQSGLLPGAGVLLAGLGLVWLTRRGGVVSPPKGDKR